MEIPFSHGTLKAYKFDGTCVYKFIIADQRSKAAKLLLKLHDFPE